MEQPTSDSQILSFTQLLQAKTSCAPWSSYIGRNVTNYLGGGLGGGGGGERQRDRQRETEREIAIAVTGHFRPSFYTHSRPPSPPKCLYEIFCFVLFWSLSLIVVDCFCFFLLILVVWIYQMFYCLICWLYVHTYITEWCIWRYEYAMVLCGSSYAPCTNFHVKWCPVILLFTPQWPSKD